MIRKLSIALALGIALSMGLVVAIAPASAEEKTCVECHGDAAIQAESERGKSLLLHLNPTAYKASVHSSLTCAECHTAGDFESIPHQVRPGSA